MNVSRLFILRPVATTLLMIAVLLSGIVAFRMLPIASLPEVDYPTIQVSTLYPGASPKVMTTTVTAPLERQFGQIPGLRQMSSTSSGGASVITLQFQLDLSLDVAEQEVQAAINAAAGFLPQDLPAPPIYSKVNPADAPIMTLALMSPTMPLPQLEELASARVAARISQLSGIGLVSMGGAQRLAVRIQVDPTQLASRGLTMENVRTAVTASNLSQAKGGFDGPLRASTLDSNDQLRSADEYRALIIGYRNAAPIRLGDVADVEDGPENPSVAAWAGTRGGTTGGGTTGGGTTGAGTKGAGTGTNAGAGADGYRLDPGVILNIQRQSGANVIETADRIHELLPQLRRSLPASVELQVLTDRTTTIRASVKDTRFELMLAIALVVMVIFLFLKSLTATLIPAVAVPLSLVGTFGVMYLAGFSINNLSLMALTIATGFVVDDAIVMIENIARHLEGGRKTALQAALDGARQIAFTIISLTFSLIAVLIPLLFMGDVVGRLFREFAITLAVAILISGAVSLSLTPMMAARLLRPHAHEGRDWMDRIIGAYDRALQFVLLHQPLTLLVALATLLATIALYVVIPKGFFPVQDTGVIQGITEADQSVSFAAMSERQQALARVVLKDPAVRSLSSIIGIDGVNTTMNSGRMLVNLVPIGERNASASQIVRRLAESTREVPGIRMHMQPVQDLSIEDRISPTQFRFTLTDSDPEVLSEWVPKLMDRLSTLPQLADLATDLQDRGLQAWVEIDRDNASRLGVTTAAITNALYNAFGQRLISTIFTQSNLYRVVLEVKPQFQNAVDALASVYVPSTTQGSPPVPLSSVARFEERIAPLAVHHLGQFPAATISFNLAPGVSLGQAVAAIEEARDAIGVPPTMRSSFQGAALAFQDSLVNMLLLIGAAIITMYIVLGVLYESFVHPVTILSTLPSAGFGALLALWLAGKDFGVIAVIGLILLIGIVKKNAIMMIDFALDAERDRGLSPQAAIHEACLLRFRPILMTTLAALLGALPMMIGGGVGSELRQPLGIAMVAGLIVSQVLTLFTTPVIYLAFDRLARRALLARDERAGPGVETSPGTDSQVPAR